MKMADVDINPSEVHDKTNAQPEEAILAPREEQLKEDRPGNQNSNLLGGRKTQLIRLKEVMLKVVSKAI